ncbi:MAG: hypothetical protein B7Y54_05880 [Polaromonas sp. 35-63-240]|nr:MAG: hypothetical protein B7Y54_05880 [Polaromonas sp. 35-63-240]
MTTSSHIELLASPSPKAHMKIWNSHPKVYLDVARTGMAKCPYCGTEYRLKAGEQVGDHH